MIIGLPLNDVVINQNQFIIDIKPAQVQQEKKEPTKHTIVKGDTLTKIAKKYNTSWQRIWSKNPNLNNQDILLVGQVLTIPDADEVLKERPLYTIPVQKAVTKPVQSSQSASTGLNGYEYPSCTGYVASRRYVPAGWGNATNWKYNAQSQGWTVSNTPIAGAIAWRYGHVAYVEAVNGDGTILLSEANYDWNGSIRTITIPASDYLYIY